MHTNTSDPAIVDLWIWPLDIDSRERERLYGFLSEDEKARVERFVHGRHARRFITARGGMRERLASYGKSAPDQLHFAANAYGKPYLTGENTGLCFNLSHSLDLAALAVTYHCEIGVDIEIIRPIEEEIAETFFSPRERADLASLPPAERERGFFQAWTRKEAFVKALGQGLAIPLDSFDVSVKPDEPPQLLRWQDGNPDAAHRWRLHHFEARSDCVGAVAIPSPHSALSFKTSVRA